MTASFGSSQSLSTPIYSLRIQLVAATKDPVSVWVSMIKSTICQYYHYDHSHHPPWMDGLVYINTYNHVYIHAIMWYLNYDSILWVHWLPLTTPTRRCVPLLKPRRGWNSYSTCLGLSAKARDALQKMGFTLPRNPWILNNARPWMG